MSEAKIDEFPCTFPASRDLSLSGIDAVPVRESSDRSRRRAGRGGGNRNSADDRDALESGEPPVDSINVQLGLAFLFSFESAPSEKLHILVHHPHGVRLRGLVHIGPDHLQADFFR